MNPEERAAPNGDSGSALVASGVALVIGATFYASRLGWGDNPIAPILLTVGLSWFLIHFAFGFRTLLALRWNLRRDSWLLSDGALTLYGVSLTAGFGALIGPSAGIPITACGTGLLLLRMRKALPDTSWKRLGFSVACTALLGLGLFFLAYSQHYHSPLFLESLAQGNAHSDALHHAAYANMIRTYGVASTGLDGLPAYRYHFGSHWLIVQLSTLLGMTVIDFYQLGYPVVFLPLLVYAIGVAGTSFTGVSDDAGRRPIAWGIRTWVVVLAALLGWLPLSMSQFAYEFFGWYPAVSESYGLSLVGLLLTVAAARPALMRLKDNPGSLTFTDRIAAIAAFPLVVGLLLVFKLSVGPLLLAAAGYAIVRLGWRRRSWSAALALGISALLLMLLIPQVFNLAYSASPVRIRRFLTSGLVDARSLPAFPLIHLLWLLLAIWLRSTMAGLRKLRDLASGRLLDIECICVIAAIGFGAAILLRLRQDAFYFFDVQNVVALAALLGAMQALPPLVSATGSWWKRLGSLAPANLALVALMATVLGIATFRCGSEGYEFVVDNLHTRGFVGEPPGIEDFPVRERILEVEQPLRAGEFATSWERVLEKTRETEGKTDPKWEVIALLKSLDRLPLKDKRRTILHIPKTNRAYWDIFPPEHAAHGIAGPFIGPAVSGLAMLEGLPDTQPTTGYGYVSYPLQSFVPLRDGNLPARKDYLCERAASMRFRRVIVMDVDASGKQHLIEWPLADAPRVLPAP